jgi:hypothetical protein
MKFEKGNKAAKGGKRNPAGGRPTRIEKEILEAAAEIAKQYIRDYLRPVLKTYGQLAAGRLVKHRHPTTGKVLWSEIEADPATTRHFIERLVPPARLALDVAVGTPEEFYRAIQESRRKEA